MHGWIHIAEVPLVGRDLAVGVDVPLREHQVELLLGEVDVDRREGDRMERQVPCGVPRILPFVGHGDDVIIDHMPPFVVALAIFRRRRAGRLRAP